MDLLALLFGAGLVIAGFFYVFYKVTTVYCEHCDSPMDFTGEEGHNLKDGYWFCYHCPKCGKARIYTEKE